MDEANIDDVALSITNKKVLLITERKAETWGEKLRNQEAVRGRVWGEGEECASSL